MRAQVSTQLKTGTRPAGMLWLTAALLLAMAIVSPLRAQAQGNYVYVNNQAAANTVSAYSVSSTGSLTPVSGSPFSTGGVGANVVCYGLNRIVLSPVNNLLFVANTGDRTITAFQINPASGVLTSAGAPFATALTLDACQGISLAATPDGNFLMASSNGQIQTFSIAAGGALTSVGLTPNCCSPNASMVISPNGQFLAVSNETSVSMFIITPGTGVLTAVAGSPFPKTGSGSLSGLDFSCAADRLYAGEATGSPALADAWVVNNTPNLATTGALTPAPGTPFSSSGTNSNLVLYSPDNTLLFQSNQFTNSVNSFTVNPDGSLTNVGRFGGTTQVHTPAGMATDATGTFLYVADDNFGVAVFRIGNGGVLASLSDLAINRPGEIQDLVAYPARSCNSADLTLTMTAVPATAAAGAPIQYKLNITNNSSTTISSAVVADTFPPTLTAGGNSPIVNPAGAKRTNTVSGNTVTGNVTITTTVPHQLFPGETVTISSVLAPTTPNPIQSGFFLTDPSFNGVFQILAATANSFTYTQSIPLSQFPQPTLTIAATNGAQRLSNTVTITATQPFQLPAGTSMTIASVGNPSFDGTFAATQTSATTFTYQQTGPDAVSGGGTASAPTFVASTDTAGGGSANNATCLVTAGPGTCSFANFAPHPVIVAGTGANRSGNVVTITTAAPHQIFAGQSATISGVADTTFNGTFTVASVPSPTTFTYQQTAANAVSGGGSVSVPATAAQLITFPALGTGETRSALLTATTKTNLTNGTVISNTANITNKSTVDPNPADNSATATITIGTQTGTTLTVPTATGPYGGNATVTATLKTSGGTPIPNETIGFNFNQNNSVYNAVTDANGVATALVPLGFTTVGTHPQAFTVTFGGDANFAASSALGDLIVTKAQLTVTADNQARLYGDPNPPFTYVISGFVNGDTISVVSGAADCTSTATSASPVGVYPITCTIGTLSAQNYVFAFVAGTLTVNPAPLTVDVANASRAYGDPNPAFTGTIAGLKNGDVITANYSTTATQLSPVGTYPITATLVDPNSVLGNYIVTINNGTLTITPAALVVTGNSAARLYGDPNPPLSGTIAGIKNGDNITATYATTATLTSPVGNYPIVPTLVDPTNKLGNYIVTLSNGTLVVSPAPLTVIVANATRPRNAPDPIFTGTITGIKNGDDITAAYSTTATAASPVGTYPITATLVDPTGKLGNYAVTITPGTLTITAAQLTVTANNTTRVYGDPNPAFTVSFSGFINGDTAAVVSGTPNCTSADPTSAVGTYQIVCTQGTLAATNYVFVFVNGTLTVTPAPLTVTAANATRLYGDANPAFSGTITGIKNGDNITATYSTTATVTSLIGTYSIVPVLVDPTNKLGNYTLASNNATLTVTQAPLVVTAANLSRAYADPNPALTGTITGIRNGDPITVTFTTAAVQSSPAGTYAITPSLTDPALKLSNYTVTINNGTLTVSPVPLTVNVASATRAFGAPNPAFTGTLIGLKNADNITAVYTTTATAASPAGTYPITATLVDPSNALGNYVVTINPGTLTITSAVLSVTAANASRFYGDPNPQFTGTISGIANGDNITATYASVADPTSPIGTYVIVPTLSDNGTGALANYVVVSNNGVLTVNPAPLTVTVASVSRLYGDPNPALSAIIAGIKNGDSITAAVSAPADPTSPVGTYPIVATLIDPTNKLGNYTVTINNGTLTVTPAPLSVTAANASRLFGTPNPPLSGIITGIKNGDPITATYSTTAIATSPVGTYSITPALVDPAGKLGNYTVTSNNGTLTVNAAPTANFVFVNNQASNGNSIAGYSVAADGTLTPLAGSPVITGGLGANVACSSVNRLALSAGNNLLFVSNGGDQTISAFQINPASGALTAAIGSPFASGLTLDACSGISLSATPDGQFLMASSNGQIKTFSIGAGGTLTSVSTASNPVVPNSSMKISANGQLLAVSNGASVSVFSINPDGSLTAVAGSPFAEAGTGSLAGLDFSSTSGLLYGAESSATAAFADAWTIGANGALSSVAGSPFSTTAINSNVVLLSPNDSFLFASNQGSNSVSSYSVNAGGLTGIGSFGSATSLHAPVGMATDRSGSLLYVADDTFGVAVFRIDGAGSLSQLGDVAIAGAGQVQDLVAYPPRMASNADLSVTISASSPNVVAGQNVTYTITLTNNGVDPAAATVTDSLPSGFSLVSCAATGNGACIGGSAAANFYLLQSGEAQTVTLVAQAGTAIPDGTVTTNTVSISNSSAVDLIAANNSASASVTVLQPANVSTLAVAAASTTYGGSATLSATLTTAAGPLAGKTVSFTLNGSPAGSAVTDATGLASVPASLVGIAAGSYPTGVAASFAGDVTNTASSASATLIVNPAVLTVTAANATRIYGDPNPAFSFTITGFVNGETVAVVSGSPSCTSADPTSAVGTYPISCTTGTLSTANYTFTFVGGTLTVTPAALSVTAANATRIYGDPNPVFTGTITGIKNGDNITASYSTAATAVSPVGTYPITPALVDPAAKLGNYTVTVNNGTLTVSPALLTATAANAARLFGAANPAFTGTLTGVRNGDNITATFATAATPASPVGTYPIVPTLVDPAGSLSNYSVVSNNGVLTVTGALLTVTTNSASRLYGDPNPVFTGTITGIQNGDNITATYASVADPTSAVGNYAIVPTLVDPTGKLANYTVVVSNGILTVTPVSLTVTADNASRLYGDPNPAFTGTIAGLRNGDNITAAFASAGPANPIGTYPITPSLVDPTGKAGNYSVTFVNGTLTVSPAPLSVTAANASRFYGDPNPAFTGTISGVKNGDNITASYSSIATPASPLGTYPIVPALLDPTGKLGNYTVTAINNGILTVTPAPLTVTAANATRLYGDPNPALTGTITGIRNADAITASYSTVATPASSAGAYAIVPTLADPTGKLGNYTVVSNNGILTVSPAPLTVATANASRVYGDPNPVFSGTITGLKNGDNITATFGSAATAASPVGTYPIVPSFIDPAGQLGNYTVVSSNGILTVSPAPLTAAAAAASRLYGAANPAFTGTITGLKNGDLITATFSSAAAAASPVGTYPIVPTFTDPGGKLGNYTVISSGTLTVTPAPLSVTAANATRVYGNANPVFTGTITGLLNGDSITESFTSAGPASPVGTYAIVPSLVDPTGKAGNYSVTFTNGTLTVTPAPLSVAAANTSRLYGDPNPVLTGTITGIQNGDNITASFATAATPASAVGSFAIVPTLIDPTAKLGNYTVTSINGTLIVNRAPLTVAAANAARTFGAANPALTGTITGIKNADNITATYATTAIASSPVGTYPIIPTLVDPTAKLGNYIVTRTNGVLTVNKAPLTITAVNKTKVLHAANPAFTATYSGFVLGQTPASLTGTLTCTTTSTTLTPVGNFPITCSGQTSTNYAITFVAGNLSVLYASGGLCNGAAGHAILAPILANGTSSFLQGTLVPARFRVCDAAGVSQGTPGVAASFFLVKIITGTTTTTVHQVPLGAAGFTFNTVQKRWEFNNITTSNLPKGSTYGYQIGLNDGTSITFQFAVR